MIKVSVIVPVYNVEQYIERCARSLMEQTMKEGIEFIFINDCTPDGSMEVLQRVIAEYPNRRNQIRILSHSENKGIAYTRGEGIRESKGEYIGWCDSDDWCEVDMYEKMYSFAIVYNKDIVICDSIEENIGGERRLMQREDVINGKVYIKNFYKRRSHVMFLWRKIIRRSLLIDNDIYPYKDINISEDLNVCIRAFYYAKDIGNIHEPLYHYNRNNQSSLTRSVAWNYNKWLQQKKNIERLSAFLRNMEENLILTIDFLRFQIKTECQPYIPTKSEYFYTFKDCHRNILHFTGIGNRRTLLKLYILHLSYWLYIFYNKKKNNS